MSVVFIRLRLLEERIRKIKLLEEEIEKKHKAAELNKQLDKKYNALVTIRPANENDWPKEHKDDRRSVLQLLGTLKTGWK